MHNKDVFKKKVEHRLFCSTALGQVEAPLVIGWVTLSMLLYFILCEVFLCNMGIKIGPLGREIEVK